MSLTFLNPALIKTLIFILITVLGALVADMILRFFIRVPKGFESKRAHRFTTILRNLVTVTIYVVAIYVILAILGISITPLLASAGIIGLLIGLAAKPVLEDLITGFALLAQEAIAVGDFVKIDDAEGYLESIQLRSLTLRTESGASYTIPSSMVKKIINFSSHRAHVIIDVPVKADESVEKVLKTLGTALATLKEDREFAEFVLPGSVVNGIEEFRATGPMIVRATIITYPSRRLDIGRQFRFLIKKDFEKNKINFG